MGTFNSLINFSDVFHYGVMQTETPYFFRGFFTFAAKRSPAKAAVLAAGCRGDNSE